MSKFDSYDKNNDLLLNNEQIMKKLENECEN